jgi:hypothetical protein
MAGRTDFITTASWTDIFTVWFVVVDEAYQALEAQFGGWRRRGPLPSFSDSEVITVALVIDTFFHGHEALGLAFLRQYEPTLFPALPPDGHFNDRRRALGHIIEQIRRQITLSWQLIAPDDRCRLMDSAPVPVCTYMRARQNQTVAGAEYFSVMASHKAKMFGLRLYLTTSTTQVVDRWMLAPAAPHDSKVMTTFLAEDRDAIVLADGAFHDPLEQAVLRRKRNIDVWAMPRKDARQPWPQPLRQWVGRIRRRVETALSVLTTVFNVKHPQARSLSGLVARVATRLLAYNLCFLMPPLLTQLQGKTPN